MVGKGLAHDQLHAGLGRSARSAFYDIMLTNKAVSPQGGERSVWCMAQAQAMTGRHPRVRHAHLTSAYHELGKQLTSGKLSVVGQYTLQRTIGQGTYGKVRLATHRLTNERVAVKQIPKQHVASLTREIHHHRRLHHPYVLQLYEVILTESHIWMVTELCSGGELYDVVESRGALPESEAYMYFGQLCEAVAYIHAQGIVHRDLKLENILLDQQGHVKVSDFGFTREFEPHRWLRTRCGTKVYCAPEMLDGRPYVGVQVDIWSMGVILYALVCGQLPFDDDNDAILHDRILHASPYLPPMLSPEVCDLIVSILSKDGAHRPSIRDMVSHPWCQLHADTLQVDHLAHISMPPSSLMESAEEKDLYSMLQELGLAVGQIRHSVLTHACDSAGAFWWLLLHRRRRTASNTLHVPGAYTDSQELWSRASTPDTFARSSPVMPKPTRPISITRRTSSRLSRTLSTRRSSLSSTDSHTSVSLRRHKSSMSSHAPIPRRRRDSESNVYRLRKENHHSLTPLRVQHEKHKSLDESSLQRLGMHIVSRTPPPAVHRTSSPSPFGIRCRRSFAAPKRSFLRSANKPMNKLPQEDEEDEWMDEEYEFVGGLGQQPTLLLDEAPILRQRRGSPCPLPPPTLRVQGTKAASSTPLRQKVRRDVPATLLEEEDDQTSDPNNVIKPV